MKVPINWLKDYVDININEKELGDALTMSGSMAEEIIVKGDDIKGVVTGKILSIEPHKDAEKLVICMLDCGLEEPVQIVTGANNIKVNDIVPVALHGAILPNDVKIKKGKLRGVVSNGMMCSEEEIGVPHEGEIIGIMILPENTKIGKEITEVLNLKSTIIDFEITSNRPDCLSIVGMARETGATTGLPYKMPNLKYKSTNDFKTEDLLEVVIDSDKCDRFMAVAIKNIKIEQSPLYIQERLIDSGVRAINNVVDITNYVMLELGFPLHAYDIREISSGKIVVSSASENEKFTTLDGEERTLKEEMLVIKDDKKTIGIAGVMGGLDSEVKDDTTTIILECAHFEGVNIRKTSKALNIRTEASQRFEKEIDGSICNIALERALALLNELNCGEIAATIIDINNTKDKTVKLKIDSKKVNKFLGTKLGTLEIIEYLNRLDFETKLENEIIEVKSPAFRVDIERVEDIYEEIARIYGYDKIPTSIDRVVTSKAGKNRKQLLDDIVMNTMTSSGLNESISYAFISPKAFDKICIKVDNPLRNVVTIKNPLGEDFSIMRTTTIPSMLEAVSRNSNRGVEKVGLFEIGKVYLPVENEKLPTETQTLTIGMLGKIDYFDLKGITENLFTVIGINDLKYSRIEADNNTFHPGKTAYIYYKKHKIGVIGEIHPDVLDNYNIKENVFIGELDLNAIYELSNIEKTYSKLPKFPEVTRDIAIVVDEEILVQDIEEIIKSQGGKNLERFELFDIFREKKLGENKKSVAYALHFRSLEKTLNDKDVEKPYNKIISTLEFKLGGTLRS